VSRRTPPKGIKPSPKAAKARPARGGLTDLFLVVLTVFGVMTRTPVGGVALWAVDLARGVETERPSLIATFTAGPSARLLAELEAIFVQPEALAGALGSAQGAPGDGFPEPYRTAARIALAKSEGPADDTLRAELAALPEGERAIAALDRLYAGDVEEALEVYAVGAEPRERAIRRARQVGEAEPSRYATHRAFLPDAQARAARAAVDGTMGLAKALTLTWPIAAPHRVSSRFGYRVHPVLKTRKLHNGVDLSAPIGTPVLAAQAGEVEKAAQDPLNGKFIIVNHGHGVRSSYCHLDALHVEKGAAVAAGQVIADSGNTGRSTGPHLHFTLRVGRDAVDPERFRPTLEAGG
jgi:murein DD-endopeptidase